MDFSSFENCIKATSEEKIASRYLHVICCIYIVIGSFILFVPIDLLKYNYSNRH